jgi:Zn-dependent protease
MTEAQPAPRPRPTVGGLFGSARTLFRIRGVPVRADVSLLLMGFFVVYVVGGRYAGPTRLGGLGLGAVLVASVAFAVLFFTSILVHELGHAFASLDRGIPVAGITLFALGGVTESTREAQRARDEFVIVGIGPFLSLVLAGVFGLLYAATQGIPIPAHVTGYLAWTNFMLAVFNILPGYPLDGGRLLRSVLWQATGRPHRATMYAARVGQAFAALLIAFGVSSFLGYVVRVPIGPYVLTGGLWEAFVGLFLFRGASDAYRRAQLRDRLAARTVRQLMGSVPATLPAGLPLAQAVRALETRPSLLWPVGEPLLGAVTLERIDAVPDSGWASTTVADVAYPREQVTIAADTLLDDALEPLGRAPGAMLIVTDGDRAVGLLTPSLVTDATG